MIWHKNNLLLLAVLLALTAGSVLPLPAQNVSLDETLNRVGANVTQFLDQLSSVTCNEEVLQEKIDAAGKTEERLQSSFEYLVLQQNQGSEPSLYESRQPVKTSRSKKDVSMLISNGFATELLILHPYYQASFTFERLADVQIKGKTYAQIHFLHVKGRPTPTALQLRGRDYPLSLEGTALVDPGSGVVAHIRTDLAVSMADLGLKRFHTEVDYSAVAFLKQGMTYWLPDQAEIEVDTPKQHWRNVHRFTNYHLFSVNTAQDTVKNIGPKDNQ